MKFALTLALILASTLPGSADDSIPLPERQPGATTTSNAPDSKLVHIEESLLAKQKERDGGLLTQEKYQEWLTQTRFRSAMDATMESLPSSLANKSLYARILARLGQSEAREARAGLQAALQDDPANPRLLLTLGFVQSQQGDYSDAAASAHAVLDSKRDPPLSPELIAEARSLWFANKDRSVGSARSPNASPTRGAIAHDRSSPARDSTKFPTGTHQGSVPDRWQEIQTQAQITQLSRQAATHRNEAERAARIGDWQLALKRAEQAETLVPGDAATRVFRENLALRAESAKKGGEERAKQPAGDPSSQGTVGRWQSTIAMTSDWISGRGPGHRTFGQDTPEVEDLKKAAMVEKARRMFYKKNAGRSAKDYKPLSDYRGSFGLSGLARAGLNPTQQFVGSFRVDIIPREDGALFIIVQNTTSVRSLLYGHGPSWSRDAFSPMGNMSQTYQWVEPAK